MGSGWMVVQWGLAAIGAILFWVFLVAVVVTHLEERRHHDSHHHDPKSHHPV